MALDKSILIESSQRMRSNKIKLCQYCSSELSRDEVGLSKKLLEHETKVGKFTCLACMAEYLECDEEELRDKIEEFKAEGCKLFS